MQLGTWLVLSLAGKNVHPSARASLCALALHRGAAHAPLEIGLSSGVTLLVLARLIYWMCQMGSRGCGGASIAAAVAAATAPGGGCSGISYLAPSAR